MTYQTPQNDITSAATAIPPSMLDGETVAPSTESNTVISREYLTAAMGIVSLAIDKRCTIPILANCEFSESRGGLVLTATDLDLEISVSLEACADAGFNTTIPTHKLLDILKKSRKSETVSLTADITGDEDTEKVKIDTEHTQFTLDAIPVADFPKFEKVNCMNKFEISGDDFFQGLDNVKGAISKEETRYYLNGIFMHEYGDQLRMVSTDGHRMYLQDCGQVDGIKEMPEIILPTKAVTIIHKLMKVAKNRPENVEIELSDTRFTIRWGNVEIRSKLVDGTFPDYHRVMPSNTDKGAQFDATELKGAIADVSLINSTKGRAVKFTFDGDDVTLTTNNPDTGSASAYVAGKSNMQVGEGLEAGFNSVYMSDIMAMSTGGMVNFGMSGPGNPIAITNKTEGFKAVLMPMRV